MNKNRGQKPAKSKNSQSRTAPVKPKVTHHSLTNLKKGDTCPECQWGKLYKHDPATLLRITGQSPLVPEQHVMEILRCNSCSQYLIADLTAEANQKYGHSVRSLMALDKFFAGTPYYCQEALQSLLGVNLSASTVFDQTELVANRLGPIYDALL